MNFDEKARAAQAALDVAEQELVEVKRLGDEAREAKDAAEAAYDASPTSENGQRAIDARREVELVGIREERTRARVEAARQALAAAVAAAEAAARQAALDDALARGNVAAFREAAAEDVATFGRLVGELVEVAERIERRARAVNKAAREAVSMGAKVAVPTERIGEALIIYRAVAKLPEKERVRERWLVEAQWVHRIFTAARSADGLELHRSNGFFDLQPSSPVPHNLALKDLFPEIFTAKPVSETSLYTPIAEALRFEAGQVIGHVVEQGDSSEEKANFTNSIIDAALRVVGP